MKKVIKPIGRCVKEIELINNEYFYNDNEIINSSFFEIEKIYDLINKLKNYHDRHEHLNYCSRAVYNTNFKALNYISSRSTLITNYFRDAKEDLNKKKKEFFSKKELIRYINKLNSKSSEYIDDITGFIDIFEEHSSILSNINYKYDYDIDKLFEDYFSFIPIHFRKNIRIDIKSHFCKALIYEEAFKEAILRSIGFIINYTKSDDIIDIIVSRGSESSTGNNLIIQISQTLAENSNITNVDIYEFKYKEYGDNMFFPNYNHITYESRCNFHTAKILALINSGNLYYYIKDEVLHLSIIYYSILHN